MAATRYTKRRYTKKSSTVRTRRAAAAHHSNKLGKKLARQGDAPQSLREARYARRGKAGRRRTRTPKDMPFAKNWHKLGDLDIFKWLTVDPAKWRARKRGR